MRSLSRLVWADALVLGTTNVPIHVFGTADTEFFQPPHFVGSCCDGVLGRDVLRQFVFEFDQGEVKVWPMAHFSVLNLKNIIRVREELGLVSSCGKERIEWRLTVPPQGPKTELCGIPVTKSGSQYVAFLGGEHFFLDLPHGRLLLEPARSIAPQVEVTVDAKRIFRIAKAPDKRWVGKKLLRVGDQDPRDLDLWDVQRMLVPGVSLQLEDATIVLQHSAI